MKINRNLLRVLTGLGLGTIAIPILLIATGRSSQLNCEKLEKDYVVCQLEKQYIHGLWPTSPDDLRLDRVDIESQLHQNEDGDYYTYKAYVYSSNQKYLFYHYGRNKNLAETDQVKLNILINGPIKSSLQLTRSYWLSDLYFVLVGIPLIALSFVVLCLYCVQNVLTFFKKY